MMLNIWLTLALHILILYLVVEWGLVVQLLLLSADQALNDFELRVPREHKPRKVLRLGPHLMWKHRPCMNVWLWRVWARVCTSV